MLCALWLFSLFALFFFLQANQSRVVNGTAGTGRWIFAPKLSLDLNWVFLRKINRAANNLNRESQLNTWWGTFWTMRLFCYLKSPHVAPRRCPNLRFAPDRMMKVSLVTTEPTTQNHGHPMYLRLTSKAEGSNLLGKHPLLHKTFL